jgi:O-antigen/teichoic acid export membrane protein
MGANLAVKPVWFLFLLLSTRLLGPEEFGRFMFAMSYVGIISFLCEGGVDVFTMRELSTDPGRFRRMFSQTLLLKVFAGVLVAVVTFVSAYVIGLSEGALLLVCIAIIYSVVNAMMTHARYVFRAFEVMRLEARSIFIEKMAVVLFCGAALLLSHDALLFMSAFALAYVISSAMTLVMVARNIGLPQWTVDARALWNGILKPALPFALMTFFQTVYYRAGTLMLQWQTGSDTIVGYYNAGYRLVEGFALFPTIIAMPLYASFARSREDKTLAVRLLPGAVRMLLALSTLIAVPFLALGADITRLVYGPAFEPAAPAIGLIVLTMIPLGMNWLLTSLAGAIDRQRMLNVFIVLLSVMNIAAYYLLIGQFGLMGAAWTTLLTELGMAASAFWIVRDYMDRRALATSLVGVAAPALVAVFLGASGFLPGPFAVRLVLCLTVLLGGFFLTGVLRMSEIRTLLSR